MDRELLIEIGVEELPAAWLPGLTRQMAERLEAGFIIDRLRQAQQSAALVEAVAAKRERPRAGNRAGDERQ